MGYLMKCELVYLGHCLEEVRNVTFIFDGHSIMAIKVSFKYQFYWLESLTKYIFLHKKTTKTKTYNSYMQQLSNIRRGFHSDP